MKLTSFNDIKVDDILLVHGIRTAPASMINYKRKVTYIDKVSRLLVVHAVSVHGIYFKYMSIQDDENKTLEGIAVKAGGFDSFSITQIEIFIENNAIEKLN